MVEQNNIIALKKLAAKIIGGDTSANDIPGATIADVIAVITENYEASTPLILGTLTLNSVVGQVEGTTKITVTPALSSGNTYRYATHPSAIELPERNEDLSTWASWDGTSDITVEDGHKVCICEVDANNYAIKAGTATAVSI